MLTEIMQSFFFSNLASIDEVAEWLRRWTANPMCSARVGSNPILVEIGFVFQTFKIVAGGHLQAVMTVLQAEAQTEGTSLFLPQS